MFGKGKKKIVEKKCSKKCHLSASGLLASALVLLQFFAADDLAG